MTVRTAIFMIQAAILLAWPGQGFALDPSSDAMNMYQQVTRNLTKYNEIRRTKALAACINWQSSGIFNPDVRHLKYYATGEQRDRDVPGDKLLSLAVQACNEQRVEQDARCECVPVDMNGQSVLQLSQAFVDSHKAALVLEKLLPAAGPPPQQAAAPTPLTPPALERSPDPPQPEPPGAASPATARDADVEQAPPPYGAVAIQNLLAALGYDPGPANGLPNPKTESAIRVFQAKHGMEVDGRLSGELLVLLSEVVRTRRR